MTPTGGPIQMDLRGMGASFFNIYIYPLARGFFVAQFIFAKERNAIMDVGP